MKWIIEVRKSAAKVFNWIGIDGFLHMGVSATIVLIVQTFAPWWVAVLSSAIAGVGKELIWDLWLKKGQAEVKDLICDAVGILIGCLAFI